MFERFTLLVHGLRYLPGSELSTSAETAQKGVPAQAVVYYIVLEHISEHDDIDVGEVLFLAVGKPV